MPLNGGLWVEARQGIRARAKNTRVVALSAGCVCGERQRHTVRVIDYWDVTQQRIRRYAYRNDERGKRGEWVGSG